MIDSPPDCRIRAKSARRDGRCKSDTKGRGKSAVVVRHRWRGFMMVAYDFPLDSPQFTSTLGLRMNHRPFNYALASLSLLGAPYCFRLAAKSDLLWLLRVQYKDAPPPPERLPSVEAQSSDTTKEHQRNLRTKTFLSLLWVLSALGLAIWFFVLPTIPITNITPQHVLTVGSIFCFSWATLGRLGWHEHSYKGCTIFEELDTAIFWALYWLGTLFGVAAIASPIT
jgi:hypothetical protein